MINCAVCGLLSPDLTVHCDCGWNLTQAISVDERTRIRRRYMRSMTIGGLWVATGIAAAIGIVALEIAFNFSRVVYVMPYGAIGYGGQKFLFALRRWSRLHAYD